MQRNPHINWPTIEQIIDRAPLQIPPDSSVLEAIFLISRGQEGSCVLVVEGTRLVGILTERDALKLTTSGRDLAEVTIAEVIAQPAISLTLSDSQTVLSALSLMRSQRIRHLPVVDESGKLIGLITQDKIYEAIAPLETVKEIGACESRESELQEIISALQMLIAIDTSDRKKIETERQQAETALYKAHQRIVDIWESMTDAYVTLDTEWRVIYANQAATQVYYQLTNLSPEEFLGRSHWEIFPGLIGQEVEREYRRAMAEQVAVHFEVFYEPTGDWFEAHAYPSAQGLGIYFRDISDRKQAEFALLESEQKLSLFVRFAPVSVAMFDRDMQYIAVSQRWINDYNLGSIEAVLGRSHYEILPNIPEHWRQVHQQGLAGVVQRCDEDRYILPDGSLQWLRWEVQPWRISTGEVGGILIFVENISERQAALRERKQAEIALRESEQRLQAILDRSPAAVYLVDTENRYLVVNRHCAELMPVTNVDNLLGQSLYNFWPSETANTFAANNRLVIS